MTSVVPSGPRDGSEHAEILTWRVFGAPAFFAARATFFVKMRPAPRHRLKRDSASEDSSASTTFGQSSCPLNREQKQTARFFSSGAAGGVELWRKNG